MPATRAHDAHLRSGAVKAFAVTADSRLALAPDLPTVDEAGLRGLHVAVWHAIWAPKGTPKDIVSRLNGAVAEVLDNPAARKRLNDIGQELFPRERLTPAALAAYQTAEIEKWWPIIKGSKAE